MAFRLQFRRNVKACEDKRHGPQVVSEPELKNMVKQTEIDDAVNIVLRGKMENTLMSGASNYCSANSRWP